ncbi:MAG: CYTH domain-containing protein [Micavibrio sp.]
MSHKALTPRSGRNLPDAKPSFNEAATDVSEIEMKMLVPQLPNGQINKAVFSDIKNYFQKLGWIKSANEVVRFQADEQPTGRGALLTRQLDTPDMELYKKGVTLRIRGHCPDGNIKNVRTADISVKFGATQDASGALRRSEYEAVIDDFGRIDFAPLRKKYPKKDYPELHEALKGIRPDHLVEFHRPDVLRNRYLVEVPEDVTGLKGKKFFVELLLDEVSFVFDPKPQKSRDKSQRLPKEGPIVYHVDLEVETEVMFKPCAYDDNPAAKNYVSSPMTKDELNQAMSALQKHLQDSTGGILKVNKYSKAERGFYHFQKMYEELKDYVELNTRLSHKGRVQSAFSIKANPDNDNAPGTPREKLHHRLSHDFGPYIRDRGRPIARYPG